MTNQSAATKSVLPIEGRFAPPMNTG